MCPFTVRMTSNAENSIVGESWEGKERERDINVSLKLLHYWKTIYCRDVLKKLGTFCLRNALWKAANWVIAAEISVFRCPVSYLMILFFLSFCVNYLYFDSWVGASHRCCLLLLTVCYSTILHELYVHVIPIKFN